MIVMERATPKYEKGISKNKILAALISMRSTLVSAYNVGWREKPVHKKKSEVGNEIAGNSNIGVRTLRMNFVRLGS